MILIIRQRHNPGSDTKHFTAYTAEVVERGCKVSPTGCTASTTGNPENGAQCCAAKAFAQLQGIVLPKSARELSAAIYKIVPHIVVKEGSPGVWTAELADCFDIGLICPPQPQAP